MRFSIGKIPVTVFPSFWILSVFIAWMNTSTISQAAVWIPVIFISVLIHELGHALTAVLCRQQVKIDLGALGGATSRMGGDTLGQAKEFLVILMGPAFGVLLIIGCHSLMRIASWPPMMFYFFQVMVIANIFWTVLNLLPIHPLDGGKLSAIIFTVFFRKKGVRISYLTSGIVAIVCGIAFLLINSLIGAALFILFAFENFRIWKTRESTSEQEGLPQTIIQAEQEWQNNQKETAVFELEALSKEPMNESIRAYLLTRLSEYLLILGHPSRVCELLVPHKQLLTVAALRNLQLASFQVGQWNLSLESGQRAYSERPDESCALLNAFASARLKDVRSTINWLLSAKHLGAIDFDAIFASEDLDLIRQDPEFYAFMKHYRK